MYVVYDLYDLKGCHISTKFVVTIQISSISRVVIYFNAVYNIFICLILNLLLSQPEFYFD